MRYLYAFILTAMSLPVFATIVEHHGFVQDDWNNGYPEQRYHFVLDKIIEIYTPIIEAKGGTFHILRDWGDGSVNAWAWRIADEYHLEVPGGMSRFHLINEEAFILVVCHEIGHHLAGHPIKKNSTWASAEGQSDYFATNDCLKRVLKTDLLMHRPNDRYAHKKCSQIYLDPNETLICHINAELSEMAIRFSQRMRRTRRPGRTLPVKLHKRDESVVSRIYWKHPKAQCRLDTMFEGALCSKQSLVLKKNCIDSTKRFQGSRPLCWYSF